MKRKVKTGRKAVTVGNLLRPSVCLWLMLAAGMFLCVLFFVSGAGELILVGGIMAAVMAVSLGFACCYGLSVSHARVRLIWFQEFKWIPMSEVIYLKIILEPDRVLGEIKTVGKKPEPFVFSEFTLAGAGTLFPRLLRVGVRLSRKRAEAICAALSQVDRVRVILNENREEGMEWA